MFNSKSLLLFVISLVALMSCQKASLRLAATSPSDALIKTKTEGTNTETYYYDSQKRLYKIVYSSSASSATYYHEFTYTDSAVYEYHSEEPRYELIQTLPNGSIKINCTSNPLLLRLNEQGWYTGTASNCQSQDLQYDAHGFVSRQAFAMLDYSSDEQVLNDGKNIVQITGKGFSYGGGELSLNTTYIYLSAKISSIGNKNFGKLYLGKSSENLIQSVTVNGETTSYSYQFDAEQRVVQQTAVKGSTQTITSYTYY